MKNEDRKNNKKTDEGVSRRDFLKFAGMIALTAGTGRALTDLIWIDEAIAAIPASEGYLLVDTKKCQGCLSCMLACSLVHEGVENLSLARIQVIQDSFQKWPDDLTIEQCRQCTDPACVEACPTGALHWDARYGNVRMVDIKKCNGCMECVEACPYEPGRILWNGKEKHALKCDLCADTPFHWDEAGGGPAGKLACVEVCPVGAIAFTKEIPEQEGDEGYRVNLRGNSWEKLGYPRN